MIIRKLAEPEAKEHGGGPVTCDGKTYSGEEFAQLFYRLVAAEDDELVIIQTIYRDLPLRIALSGLPYIENGGIIKEIKVIHLQPHPSLQFLITELTKYLKNAPTAVKSGLNLVIVSLLRKFNYLPSEKPTH